MTGRVSPTNRNVVLTTKHLGRDEQVGGRETVTLTIPTHTRYKYEIKTLTVPIEMLLDANIFWKTGDASVRDLCNALQKG